MAQAARLVQELKGLLKSRGVTDLLKLSEAATQRLQQLSLEQETELTGDIKLLLTAYCLVNNWTFDDIRR